MKTHMHVGPAGRWLVVAFLLFLGARAGAQIVNSYDASGNPTNSFLSSSTGLNATVTNSTQTLTIGEALSLSVTANGSGPITYQWRLNGVNIAGATSATFFKTNLNGADSGTYSVVVTGATGSQTSVLGVVTVVATTNTLYAIKYSLNQYVAVGGSGSIISSSNLVSWSAPTSGVTNDLYGIAFGNNVFVAVGTAGAVLTSTNGSNWQTRNSTNSHDLMGVTFGNGIFVAVGAGGTTLTSPDGVNWGTQTYDNPTLEAVTFSNNLFVAVGTGGSIWTSTNGTNWLGHNFTTTDTLYSVAYGNGEYVAVGDFGLILVSVDGSTWSYKFAETAETFASVVFFNGTFFALGPIGENFISADGVNWNGSDAGTFSQLFGAGVGNNVPVAVGEAGTVMQIPYLLPDHFVWSAISSPQRSGQSFSATITAKDAANNTVTNFSGTVPIFATTGRTSYTTNLIPNTSPTFVGFGTNTVGYAFTPNADLQVTAVRHYDTAISVSIWDEEISLLATVPVASVPGAWVTTPLSAPLTLKAGKTYVIAAYSETGYSYRLDGTSTFADGTLDQAFAIVGQGFPVAPSSAYWFLVDLTYTVQRGQPNGVSPTTATFASGIANPTPSITSPGQGVFLTASDSSGHIGSSTPFDVYAANDLAVTLGALPSPATVQSNLTYTVTVLDSGPSSISGVNVTNILPANVSFVSATSTQGACQYTNGQVTCSVGTLSTSPVTLTIVVTPTLAGVVLTNTVSASGSGSDPNLANNTATLTTYVPPTLLIFGASVTEGNMGITNVQLVVLLSSASILSAGFSVETMDGTSATPAISPRDYIPMNASVSIPPGQVLATLPIGIRGNTRIESNKQFMVRLSNPTNATLGNTLATVTIVDDDGLPGQIQNLVWSNIASPQLTNQAIAASITAQDASGATATNFTGPASITGINVGVDSTNTLLNGQAASASASVSISTIGYEFVPTNDIYVTHVRSYGGSKVSMWTSDGGLVATQTVASVPGAWVDTQLPTPVHLLATNTYRIGVFTDGNTYYWGNSGPTTFGDGRITGSYSSPGDSFPSNQDWPQWYLVDLRYAKGASVTVSPASTNTNSFAAGVWAGNISIRETGTNFVLFADDGNGHVGVTAPFGIYQPNDLALALSLSPAVPLVFTNLTYQISVLNPGPNTSTGVLLTNLLPAGATFVSASSSQGTCSQSGGVVNCNLGTIAPLSSATVNVTVTPLIAGFPLTNSVFVTRNEPDPNTNNNVIISVIIPSLAETLALAQATEYFSTPWRSGGDAIWFAQTATNHDGIDAAQSGPVIDSQQSWMETTVYGPGNLTFWWKVSSQVSGDKFYFLTNNAAVTNISGILDWQQVAFGVAPGANVLRWSFIEDSSIHSGFNAAWLDQVSYTIPSFSLSLPTKVSNGNMRFSVGGTNGQSLILQSSTNLTQWTSLLTNVVSGGTIIYTDALATNFPVQFYRAVFPNQ